MLALQRSKENPDLWLHSFSSTAFRKGTIRVLRWKSCGCLLPRPFLPYLPMRTVLVCATPGVSSAWCNNISALSLGCQRIVFASVLDWSILPRSWMGLSRCCRIVERSSKVVTQRKLAHLVEL